jgi:hypothetical protein
MKLNAYDHLIIERIANTLAAKATPRQIDTVWYFVKALTKENAPADVPASTEASHHPKR